MIDDKTCTDCGTRPRWWYSESTYCKWCSVKGGQRPYIEVDPDAVLEMCAGSEPDALKWIHDAYERAWKVGWA